MDNRVQHEESLDPSDWRQLRQLGHRMLDDMFDFMQTAREKSVWQPIPSEVLEALAEPLPQQGQSEEATYEEFLKLILPYSLGNFHPRFWGWVMGNGTPLGMLADMLASGLNPNLGGGEQVPNHVEHQVVEWCRQMFEFPEGSSGLLVSGGSVANLIGLAAARTARAGFDVRKEGVTGSSAPLRMYGSVEMHSSLQKAVELLGLGDRALRRLPVDERYRIDTTELRRQIEADKQQGMRPICVIGCAGTVNTGGLDPLDELADIAEEHNLWYHIDGAFGALAYLSPEMRPRLEGLSRADSIAFDLHKWVYLPFEVGCALLRDEKVHRATFALTPAYLSHGDRGIAAGPPWLSEYGLQLTRSFRALKVWMAFKTYGAAKIGRLIKQNIDQANYLGALVRAEPNLEQLAPIDLNVVCFRYVAPELDETALNQLNQELLIRLHESGAAAPSGTTLGDRFALRCAITNHRSQRQDFDQLVAEVLQLGGQIRKEASVQASK